MAVMSRERIMMRVAPVIFCFVTFLLLVLALFAGNQPGVLEGYHILTVDTSGLGNRLVTEANHNIPISARTANGDCSGAGSLLDQACNSMTSAAAAGLPHPTYSAVNNANGKVNNIPDSTTDDRHIRGFYSLYPMSICEGDFAADGSRVISECHHYFSTHGASTIPALLLRGLGIAPDTDSDPRAAITSNDLSLFDLGLTHTLQSALEALNGMLQALAIILIIGIACTIATLIVSFVAIWLSSDDDENKGYTAAVWIALGFSSATVFFLILGGLVGTAGPRVAEDKIRGLGVEVGVNAAAGKLWLALPWVGVLLMAVVLGYWARRARVLRKLRHEEKEKEKEQEEEAELESRSSRRSSRSTWSSRSFHTARRSRSRHSSHRSRHRCRSCRR